MKKFLNRLNIDKLQTFHTRLNIGKLQDFHTRQKLLAYLLIVMLVLALFYWTDTIISAKREDMRSAAAANQERIVRVQNEIQKLQDKQNNEKLLNTGLQSYIQGMGQRTGTSAKFMNIKLVSSANKQEQVSFRSENLVYKDFSAILQDFEQYDNVRIKSMHIAKRFDNAKRLDVTWDIVRAAQ